MFSNQQGDPTLLVPPMTDGCALGWTVTSRLQLA